MYAAKNLLSCECSSQKGYLATTNAGMTYKIRLRSSKFQSLPSPPLATMKSIDPDLLQQKRICIVEEGYASTLEYNTDSWGGVGVCNMFFLIKMLTDCALTINISIHHQIASKFYRLLTLSTFNVYQVSRPSGRFLYTERMKQCSQWTSEGIRGDGSHLALSILVNHQRHFSIYSKLDDPCTPICPRYCWCSLQACEIFSILN